MKKRVLAVKVLDTLIAERDENSENKSPNELVEND